MEQELLISEPSLLQLNEYCLLRIFEFLELDDSISLADSCRYLRFIAGRVFKRYSEFRLCWTHLGKGEQYINSVLSHIGSHVSSLYINLFNLHCDLSKYLSIIDSNCKNLKCLKICEYKRSDAKVVPCSAYSFKNVELLTLFRFNSSSTRGFLESFHHLKSFNLVECSINTSEVETIFRNNPNIDTFYNYDIDCLKSLALIPNVQKMYLGGYNFNNIVHDVNTLLTLNSLTKLELHCMDKNINAFLRELAKKGIMEEMHLECIDIDDDFFDILTLFDKIQLLTIEYNGTLDEEQKRLKTSIAWPRKLKNLRLTYFELTLNDFIEIIRQLDNLQRMDLCMSHFTDPDLSYFEDLTKCSKQTVPRILKVVGTSARDHCLEIVLPYVFFEKEDKKYLIETDRIKVLYTLIFADCDHLQIKIDFPAIDDL